MRHVVYATVVLWVLLCPTAGYTQQSRRPYRGLFGSGMSETEQSWTATATLGGGWDDNLVSDALGSRRFRLSDANTAHSGSVAFFTGSTRYSLDRGRFTVGASGQTSARYYNSLSQRWLRRENLQASATVRLLEGLSAHGSAGYRPHSLSSILPTLVNTEFAEGTDPDVDFGSSLEHYVTYGAGLSYTTNLTRHTTFSTGYDYRTRSSTASVEEFYSHGGSVRLIHTLRQGVGLRVGYRYVEGHYGNDLRKHQIIDAGVDYSRALSFSRNTTLSFSTGTDAVARPEEGQATETRYRLNANVNLAHELGRSWTLGAAYARAARFEESWNDVVFSDSAVVGIRGLLSRRVRLHAAVGTSTGRVDSNATGDGFDSVRGVVNLGFGLTRYANAGLTVAHYRHFLGSGITVAPGFAGNVRRNSVSAYLNLWAPLFSRSRSGNATR